MPAVWGRLVSCSRLVIGFFLIYHATLLAAPRRIVLLEVDGLNEDLLESAMRHIDPATGKLHIVRVTLAWESGAVINPDGLRNQQMGAVVQALGGALFEQIFFADGKILNPHFAQYRVPRFQDTPRIEVVLLDRKDLRPAGAGEIGIIGVAPAIGNAYFAATGKRLRQLPMAPKQS